MKERSTQFHDEWLKLTQPYEGLVFSVPVLAEAQIAPDVPADLSTRFAAFLVGGDDKVGPRIASARHFFERFLGYHEPGRLVPRGELPTELSFYAPEGGQELRPTFALARGPFETVDPFAEFAPKVDPQPEAATEAPRSPYFALVWDVAEDAASVVDLDKPETETGAWRYPPTAKFERLLRHTGVPVGLLFNGPVLRLVYAPSGESTSHLSFRVADMAQRDGRKILAALELLLHARRAYGAATEHTLEGLLAASRKRQADVTEELARQVFDAVETLLTGFEHAARRDVTGERLDWLRAALETEGDRKQTAPFHWMLEFPEVFFDLRPDPLQRGEVNGAAYMEAVVGNPPFAGKNTITDGNGPSYLEWLQALHTGAHGNSDLSAHFFRRAATLLGPNGTLGLIATNTIAQGDTRATGLKALIAAGWRLYEATSMMPWPGAAAVTVAIVHAAVGRPTEFAIGEIDGRTAGSINSRLRPKPERADPVALKANVDAAFVGSYVLGMGFTLTREERGALVAKDRRNAERTFPYLGGDEVNSSPTHDFDRYVINFWRVDAARSRRLARPPSNRSDKG